MKNLPDGANLGVGKTGAPETCPKCGIAQRHGRPDAFWCGSIRESGRFDQSDLCRARQEIAALKARAEKAEAERDEARGVVKRAVELIGEMQLWGGSDELALAGAWFDVLPEWAREAKDAARK